MHEDDLPLHGGDILSAVKRYAIPLEQWIDLSTGMNPQPYPIPAIPAAAFHQLPYIEDAFLQAIKNYYGRDNFLAVAGSQAVIQQLPMLLNNKHNLPILLPDVGYKEHEQHWLKYGASIQYYPALDAKAMVNDIDIRLQKNNRQHLLIINPNNPTGVQVTAAQLLSWAACLSDDACLIVDEAFIDLTPQQSVLMQGDLPNNIVVLRSFGKFFGLAGLRLGVVFADVVRLETLQQTLGLWQVNGPAQFIACQAFSDTEWQQQARLSIAENSKATQALFAPLLQHYQAEKCQANDLFCAYKMPYTKAKELANCLANKGILIRVVEIDRHWALIRIGILPHSTCPYSTAFSQVKKRLSTLIP